MCLPTVACAVRRQIPLVLVDRAGDVLEPWATASVARSGMTAAIAALDSAQSPAHTAVAVRTLDEELGQPGTEALSQVVVRRRRSGLVVDLSPEAGLSGGETEKLAVHIVQRLRAFDPWAKTIDVRSD